MQFHREINFLFLIDDDFDTLATPIEDDSHIYQEHHASSYGYIVVDWTGNIISSDFYRGEDAANKFLYSIFFRINIKNKSISMQIRDQSNGQMRMKIRFEMRIIVGYVLLF